MYTCTFGDPFNYPGCNGTCPDDLTCGHNIETNKCVCGRFLLEAPPDFSRPTPTPTPTPTPNLECNGSNISAYTAEVGNDFCSRKHCDIPNSACKVVATNDDRDTGKSTYFCGCVTPTPTPTPIPCRGYYTGRLTQEQANTECGRLNASCRLGCRAIQPVSGGPDSFGFTRWICGCGEDLP